MFGTTLEMTDDHTLETDPNGKMYLYRNGNRYAHCPKGGVYFDSIPDHDLFDDLDVPDPSTWHPPGIVFR